MTFEIWIKPQIRLIEIDVQLQFHVIPMKTVGYRANLVKILDIAFSSMPSTWRSTLFDLARTVSGYGNQIVIG